MVEGLQVKRAVVVDIVSQPFVRHRDKKVSLIANVIPNVQVRVFCASGNGFLLFS